MVDRYWRKIEDVKNDIEISMQICGILLKLKEYDEKLDNLSKKGDNENNVASNLGQINGNISAIKLVNKNSQDNSKDISSNLEKITNISDFLTLKKDFEKIYNTEKRIFKFNKTKHFYSILQEEIEYYFSKNGLLFVKNNMYYKYDNLANDYYRLQHEYNIYDEVNNLIHKYLFNKDTYYDKNSNFLHTNEDFCIYLKKL